MEPVPVDPRPPMKIDWQAWSRAGVVLLTLLSAIFLKDDTKPDDKKPDVPAVVTVEPPAPPAPAPAPTPVVVAAPESWIVLDKDGVRTVDAAIEKIAGSLKPGRWTAQGIPKPGEKGVSLTITVDDGVTPVPPVVVPPGPTPDPPKPPEPKPPVVVEGKRQVLVIRESLKDSAEFSRLCVDLRRKGGIAESYLTSKGHKLYLLDDNDVDMGGKPTPLVEKWRPHYAGMALPVVFILDDKGELLAKQAIDPKVSDPAIVLDILKSHGG